MNKVWYSGSFCKADGYTLIEVLFAAALAGFVLIAILGTISLSASIYAESSKRVTAASIASHYMEEILKNPCFNNLQAIYNDGPNVRRPVEGYPGYSVNLKVKIRPGTGCDVKEISVTVYWICYGKERSLSVVGLRTR